MLQVEWSFEESHWINKRQCIKTCLPLGGGNVFVSKCWSFIHAFLSFFCLLMVILLFSQIIIFFKGPWGINKGHSFRIFWALGPGAPMEPWNERPFLVILMLQTVTVAGLSVSSSLRQRAQDEALDRRPVMSTGFWRWKIKKNLCWRSWNQS